MMAPPQCWWNVLLCCPCRPCGCSCIPWKRDDYGKKHDVEMEPLIDGDDRMQIEIVKHDIRSNQTRNVSNHSISIHHQNSVVRDESLYKFYNHWEPRYWRQSHKIIEYERYFSISSKYPMDPFHSRQRQKLYHLMHDCFTKLPVVINQHIHDFLPSHPLTDHFYTLYLDDHNDSNPITMENADDLGCLVDRSTILDQHRIFLHHHESDQNKQITDKSPSSFWKWIGLNSKYSRHGMTLIVCNDTKHELNVNWISFRGHENSNALIYPASSVTIGAFVSHSFVIRGPFTGDGDDDNDGLTVNDLSVVGIYQIRHSFPTHLVTVTQDDDETQSVGSLSSMEMEIQIGSPITEIPVISKMYSQCLIGGFTVFYEESVFDEYPKLRTILESDLCAMALMLKVDHLKVLQRVSIWLNISQSVGHPDAVNRGYGLTFHHDAEWMKKNGVDLCKCGNIEIYSARDYMEWRVCQPLVLFHEFVHSFHCFIGRDRGDIRRTYNMAMERRLYDLVQHIAGIDEVTKKKIIVWRRGYAASNCYEYFAQMSEAYFGQCNYYPFNKQQLKAHDINGYRLCIKLWSLSADQIQSSHTKYSERI